MFKVMFPEFLRVIKYNYFFMYPKCKLIFICLEYFSNIYVNKTNGQLT